MIFSLTLFVMCLTASTVVAGNSSGEWVVLIHGLGRSRLSMKCLEMNLQKAGYQTLNLSYPSRRFTVEQLADHQLNQAIVSKIPGTATRINFVTHSLGGIILRQYLSNHTITNLGRIVMLAPPNQGSELMDHVRKFSLCRWIIGPGGCELGTSTNDLPKRLGPAQFGPGIIAGDFSPYPWTSLILPRPNDGIVSVESTKIEGMSDFLLVHNGHTLLMWRKPVIRQILAFLRHGRFDRNSTSS